MTLKPWREIAEPHEDVRKGTFVQAEFAADITRVHTGTASPEYQNPTLFFERTFITEGMALLLDSVVKRLAGKGGDPVIQLQTAFGGGKTHTMLAVYHLASGKVPASEMPGIPNIIDKAGVSELPRARIAVLDGIKASPNQPVQHGSVQVHTLWGDLAWQLGGEEGYALVASADQSGTSPGKDVLEQVLKLHSPCVILVDELVAYIRQFEEGKALSGGTFDSNLSFIQALTEALKAVPTAVMLASLPESEKEAGSQRGVRALESLSHYFGRVQALWKPVGTEEAFEIVRRRLFSNISDRLAAEKVCRTFADYYIANSAEFPAETQESRYYERLLHAYPIHPEVFDRLYEDWSTLDNFQRTRGVLKMMAKMIFSLWKDGNNDPLIMPGSLPLADPDSRNEVTYYLPPGWDPVMERDIDGPRAETVAIENQNARLGSVQACRRTARTIFLGSAPTTSGQVLRGIELMRIMLGTVQPGQQVGLFKDALRSLLDKLHYLNNSNNHYWFDTRPNLRREMEERKKRYKDKEDVFPAIRKRAQESFAGGLFGGIHVFTDSVDVPDDWQLRLVVLSPDAGYSKSGTSQAILKAGEILKNRGDQPRGKQNRLIFLAAEQDNVSRLKDQVRTMLAWESIVNDYKDNRITLDNLMARNATASLDQAKEALKRMIRETYKWLLAPVQTAVAGRGLSDIQWEHFPVNPGAANLTQEIERVLKENELLITEWAPYHLANMLKTWFWKDDVKEVVAQEVWQKSCCYLYLPRLRDSTVFLNTLSVGLESGDFFGVAQGKDGDRYLGFVFAKSALVTLDACEIIEPSTAAAYAEKLRKEKEEAELARRKAQEESDAHKPDSKRDGGAEPEPEPQSGSSGTNDPVEEISKALVTQFYASTSLDPVKAKMDFALLVDEVVQQFTAKLGVDVKISVEIQATSKAGFDDGLQRAVKENCNVLKFSSAEFE
ncbi:TPA: ATP-binding protein [Pseudomonas aeruginosa]|nr:ATP-binding protein [Pseudomonas aeruginosa]